MPRVWGAPEWPFRPTHAATFICQPEHASSHPRQGGLAGVLPTPGARKVARGRIVVQRNTGQPSATRAVKRSPARQEQPNAARSTQYNPAQSRHHMAPTLPASIPGLPRLILRFAHPALPCDAPPVPCGDPPPCLQQASGDRVPTSGNRVPPKATSPRQSSSLPVRILSTHTCTPQHSILPLIQPGQHSASLAFSMARILPSPPSPGALAAHVLCPSTRRCHAALPPSWIRGGIACSALKCIPMGI